MDIRCIALDLDRTTLNAEGRLSPGNRAALLACVSKGIEVVPASGRSFASLPEEIRTLPGLRYAITSNGAVISTLPEGRELHRLVMSRESVEAIRARVREQRVTPAQAVFLGGQAYAPAWYLDHLEDYGVSGYGLVYVRSTCRSVPDWESFLDENGDRLDSYDVFEHDPARREALFADLKALPALYFTASAPHMLEMSHPDTGKGRGLQRLLSLLGLEREQCAAFGDGENDADLLRAAGVGIAVENAAAACREAAAFVTKHHDEDGVAYALEHYLGVL